MNSMARNFYPMIQLYETIAVFFFGGSRGADFGYMSFPLQSEISEVYTMGFLLPELRLIGWEVFYNHLRLHHVRVLLGELIETTTLSSRNTDIAWSLEQYALTVTVPPFL